MFKVLKATDLKGNLKDSDNPELIKRTGVDKRFGLYVVNCNTLDELINEAQGLILWAKGTEYYIRTSSISDVVLKDDDIKVITRNTIYYLIEEEEK
jgi:predicted transcriptional regulator